MDLTPEQRTSLDAALAEAQAHADRRGRPQPVQLDWMTCPSAKEARWLAALLRAHAQEGGTTMVVGTHLLADATGYRPDLWVYPARTATRR